MKNLVKIADQSNLYRDIRTKAIVKIDAGAQQNYVNQRSIAQKQQEMAKGVEQDINMLKKEMADIKEMLNLLIKQIKR